MKRGVALEVKGLSHRFGENRVLYDINLEIEAGTTVAVVGPSGCGKSTLLQCIKGKIKPTEGAVYVHRGTYGTADGTLVRSIGADRGYVDQSYLLFEDLTAVQNVAYGLRIERRPFDALNPLAWIQHLRGKRRIDMPWNWITRRSEDMDRAAEMLKSYGLGSVLNNYPSQLSGGQRQRVAIAMTLIKQPEIAMLDEPFASLDAAVRADFCNLVLQIRDENIRKKLRLASDPNCGERPTTILLVTHDITEALFVADRVIGLTQYYDWKSMGFTTCPGATIVYDAAAPVYKPESREEFDQFQGQRQEIWHNVINPDVLQSHSAFVRYWADRSKKGAAT